MVLMPCVGTVLSNFISPVAFTFISVNNLGSLVFQFTVEKLGLREVN